MASFPIGARSDDTLCSPSQAAFANRDERKASDSDESDTEVDSAQTLVEKINSDARPHRGPDAKAKPRKKGIDIDNELEIISRKLINVAVDESVIANSIPEAACHLPNDPHAIRHLLPHHGQKVMAALHSDWPEYILNAIKLMRRYMCADEVPEKTDRVLELNILQRLGELLQMRSHHMIQYEACWVLTNIAAGTPAHTAAVVEAGLVPLLISLLGSDGDAVRVQAAWTLGNVAGDCKEYTQMLLDGGIMQPLLEISFHQELTLRKAQQARHVVCWVLANLCRWDNKDWTQIEPCFHFLSDTIMHNNDPDVLSEAIWALSRIFHAKHKGNDALINQILMTKLISLMKCERMHILIPVFRVMTNVSGDSDPDHTQILIESGVLHRIKCILEDRINSPHQIAAEALHCLSNITAGTTEQKEAVSRAKLFGPVRSALTRGDYKVRKEACHVIRNAVDRDATPEHFRDVVGPQGEIFKPLIHFLGESEDDPETQLQVVETLNIIFSRGDEPLIRALYPFAQPNVNVYVTCMNYLDAKSFERIYEVYQRTVKSSAEDLAPMLHSCLSMDREVGGAGGEVKKQVVNHVVAAFKPGMTGKELVKTMRARKALARDFGIMFGTYLRAHFEKEEKYVNDVEAILNGVGSL
ncbi:armadillo-type protein [Chytriomyces sp. MP71]|nr:armadillo-type protein [Chytriomyces sp. MP71]